MGFEEVPLRAFNARCSKERFVNQDGTSRHKNSLKPHGSFCGRFVCRMQKAVSAIGLRTRKFTAISARKRRTPRDVYDWLSTAKDAYASLETYYWAIVEKESGTVIGEIFVDGFSARNGWCELDWKLGTGVLGQRLRCRSGKGGDPLSL